MGSLCKIHSSVQVPLKSRLAMELEDCFSWRLPLVKTQNKMNDKTHLVINFNQSCWWICAFQDQHMGALYRLGQHLAD